MFWASSPHQVVIRGYATEKEAALRQEYLAVGSLDLLMPGTGFMHATLRAGGQLSPADWRSLVEHIERTHGTVKLLFERDGQMVTLDTINRRISREG